MRYFFLIITITLCSCNSKKATSLIDSPQQVQTTNPIPITSEQYQLYPALNQKALLIVFPCFPCDAQNTFDNFNIVNISLKNQVSVLLLDFNMHLYLSTSEKIKLSNLITDALKTNNIPTKNTFIGGFSGGGNMALLMSNFLVVTKNEIQPKGVFIVDAPIDLVQLYEVAQANIAENYSEVSVEEAKWIVNLLDTEFGSPDTALVTYERYSPYVTTPNSEKNISNVHNVTDLKNLNIRFYTEPDTTWWWENRHVKYEQMNAYAMENLATYFQEQGGKKVEYITTQNKGFRADGERHPHSWSIVDKEDLMKWILEE